jgi:hypothetical protein
MNYFAHFGASAVEDVNFTFVVVGDLREELLLKLKIKM